MVWLFRSPIPVGRRAVIPRLNYFYLPLLRVEESGGGRHPVLTQLFLNVDFALLTNLFSFVTFQQQLFSLTFKF